MKIYKYFLITSLCAVLSLPVYVYVTSCSANSTKWNIDKIKDPVYSYDKLNASDLYSFTYNDINCVYCQPEDTANIGFIEYNYVIDTDTCEKIYTQNGSKISIDGVSYQTTHVLNNWNSVINDITNNSVYPLEYILRDTDVGNDESGDGTFPSEEQILQWVGESNLKYMKKFNLNSSCITISDITNDGCIVSAKTGTRFTGLVNITYRTKDPDFILYTSPSKIFHAECNLTSRYAADISIGLGTTTNFTHHYQFVYFNSDGSEIKTASWTGGSNDHDVDFANWHVSPDNKGWNIDASGCLCFDSHGLTHWSYSVTFSLVEHGTDPANVLIDNMLLYINYHLS